MKRLACILTLALAGCQSSGTADGGDQHISRVEVKPTTEHFKAVGIPADQAMVLWELWREHPPEKGASK